VRLGSVGFFAWLVCDGTGSTQLGCIHTGLYVCFTLLSLAWLIRNGDWLGRKLNKNKIIFFKKKYIASVV
jgi:hypothetical protein